MRSALTRAGCSHYSKLMTLLQLLLSLQLAPVQVAARLDK